VLAEKLSDRCAQQTCEFESVVSEASRRRYVIAVLLHIIVIVMGQRLQLVIAQYPMSLWIPLLKKTNTKYFMQCMLNHTFYYTTLLCAALCLVVVW